MKERWADIMDSHDKKRPTVRPKVELKTTDIDKPNGTVDDKRVPVPPRVCL